MDTNKVLKMLKTEEGFKTKPYKCPSGFLTIGIGHNLDANGMDADLLEEQFKRDVKRFEAALVDIFKDFKSFSEPRQLAFLNMIFQLGVSGFKNFKMMIVAANEGNWTWAAAHAGNSIWAKIQTPQRAARVTRMIRENIFVYD